MNPEFQYDVFLSHNQADKPRVRRLAERLRAAGLSVGCYPLAHRSPPLAFSLQPLDFPTVLCLSPAALGSDWVGLERSTVLFRDPANAGRRFIPLLLADCKLPDTLRRYVAGFRDDIQAVGERLLEGVLTFCLGRSIYTC